MKLSKKQRSALEYGVQALCNLADKYPADTQTSRNYSAAGQTLNDMLFKSKPEAKRV